MNDIRTMLRIATRRLEATSLLARAHVGGKPLFQSRSLCRFRDAEVNLTNGSERTSQAAVPA